jgi:hypothetical protein
MVMIRSKEKICKICHPRWSLALGVLMYWHYPDVCTRHVGFGSLLLPSLYNRELGQFSQYIDYVMDWKTVQFLAEEKKVFFSAPSN